MLVTKALVQDPRVYKEARALVEDGHDVTVVEWARHVPEQPRTEVIDGIQVVRMMNTTMMGRLGRAVLQNPFWWRMGWRCLRRMHGKKPIDAVHCHDLDTLPIGTKAKRRLGTRLVFDAHEVFAQMIRHDHPRIVSRAAQWLEDRLLQRVDAVITVNRALETFYRDRYNGPVHVVRNCPELPHAESEPEDGPFTLVYVGLLQRDRFFPDCIHVLGQMEGVRFIVAGKREGIYDEVEEAASKYSNVAFLGPVRFDEVMPITMRGHAVLCMYDPAEPHIQVATVTKMLDAMAAGRPVIITRDTYSGRFVQEHGNGVAIEYNADALREAVIQLRDDPEQVRDLGRKGRRLAEQEYNWAVQAKRLCALYDEWI